VLNFKNKKAVPQHCFYSYRESGLVQQVILKFLDISATKKVLLGL